MELKYIPIFTTRDFDKATLLMSVEQSFLGEEWKSSICYFSFSDEKKCEAILLQFDNGELSINPKKVFEAQRTLKSIIFNR